MKDLVPGVAAVGLPAVGQQVGVLAVDALQPGDLSASCTWLKVRKCTKFRRM